MLTLIEKLFHRIAPQHRSLLPERDIEPVEPATIKTPRSILIEPRRNRPARTAASVATPPSEWMHPAPKD